MIITHLRSALYCDVEMVVKWDFDGGKTEMVVELVCSEGEIVEK